MSSEQIDCGMPINSLKKENLSCANPTRSLCLVEEWIWSKSFTA